MFTLNILDKFDFLLLIFDGFFLFFLNWQLLFLAQKWILFFLSLCIALMRFLAIVFMFFIGLFNEFSFTPTTLYHRLISVNWWTNRIIFFYFFYWPLFSLLNLKFILYLDRKRRQRPPRFLLFFLLVYNKFLFTCFLMYDQTT